MSGRTGHAEASDGESAGRDGYPHWRRGDAGGDPAVSGTDAGETFHMSGKKVLDSAMTWRNPRVNMGLPGNQ